MFTGILRSVLFILSFLHVFYLHFTFSFVFYVHFTFSSVKQINLHLLFYIILYLFSFKDNSSFTVYIINCNECKMVELALSLNSLCTYSVSLIPTSGK